MGNYAHKEYADALPIGYAAGNRYRVEAVLGRGGFGITYRVCDLKNGNRQFAMKELFPNQSATRIPGSMAIMEIPGHEALYQKMQESFLKEARVLSQIRNIPGICHIYHVFLANNTTYYVMDYLEGTDLQHWFSKRGTPLPWPEVAAILKQLLPTLNAVHSAGIVHRDISPDNIFLLPNGGIRLIDFGSARKCSNGALTVFVKSAFAPWEQYLENGNYGPWTDIYSLGVTAYYLLTGKLPPRVSERMQGAEVIHLRRLISDIPDYAANAIHKAMEIGINDRFQNVSQFYQSLFAHEEKQTYFLYATAGIFSGKQWALPEEKPVRLGRQAAKGQLFIKFPDQHPGVSRVHCTLLCRNGSVYLRDEHSHAGTYVNGQRLRPGKWYRISSDSVLQLAADSFRLVRR